MAKGAGHQVSLPRDRRRKSKERGRGDMEGEGGGARWPLLFSSPLHFFPPFLPLSGLSSLLVPFSPFSTPFSPFFQWRKWEVKGEQEAACIHLCAVKAFLFFYHLSALLHQFRHPPLSFASQMGAGVRAALNRHPDVPPLSCLFSFLAVLWFLSVMDVCGSGGPGPPP